MGVTVFQYLAFTFLPGILGKGLAGTEFMWPKKELHLFGVDFTWSLIIFFFVFKIIFPEGEAAKQGKENR